MADKMVIWRANIDANRSRSRGRKIAKGVAIKDPDIKELSKAAHNLSLQSEREKDKGYPKDRGIEDHMDGRILISKQHSKSKTLKLLADEIRRLRKSEKEQ
ncbi:MAG: signal recognition particle subunit SRP19/SEC65 family protein [Candidatus Methanofastidiosia archaeon]